MVHGMAHGIGIGIGIQMTHRHTHTHTQAGASTNIMSSELKPNQNKTTMLFLRHEMHSRYEMK